jgi:hypothetical protein
VTGSQDFEADPRNEHVVVWLNGTLVPRDHAKISVFDAGFVLGDGVWEGLRLHNGAFSTGGNNTFSLTDDRDLTTTGTVNAGSHGITLTTTGSGHDLAIDSKLEGGEVKLASAAAIAESNAGDLDAKTLTGSAHGAVKLTSAKNTVTDLGAFTTGGNNAFSFTDDHALTVDGKMAAGTGMLDLTTVGSGHNLAIASAITGGTVNLITTGEATVTSKGAITAKLLNVTASTGIDLTAKANKIKKLGTDKTKKGPNKVTL